MFLSMQGLLKLSASNHIVVENLLVRNSNKSGIVFDHSNNVVVRNTVVHDTWVRHVFLRCNVVVYLHYIVNVMLTNIVNFSPAEPSAAAAQMW
jgi:hypothetical protein